MDELQQEVQLDLSGTPDIKCPNCNNITFEMVFRLKAVSALVSPNGQAGVARIPTLACNACGAPLLPKAQQTESGESGIQSSTIPGERPNLKLEK